MTNWPPVRRSACSRSWTRSAGSRPSSIQDSAIGPKTWLRALEGACASTGYPKTIRVDQGSEFVSRDLDLWAYAKGVTLDFSRPGKPTDNAFIEAFNGRLRAECLNAHWFLTLADAREKLEDWRKYYNRASEHPSVYAIELNKLCWSWSGPAGASCFGGRVLQSICCVRHQFARAKSQAVAQRMQHRTCHFCRLPRVLVAIFRTCAASERLSHGSTRRLRL